MIEIRRRIKSFNLLGQWLGKYNTVTSSAMLVNRTPKGVNVRLANGDVIHRKAKDVV